MDKIGNIARRIAKGILAKPVLTQEALDAMGSQTCPVLLCEISGFSVDEKTGETKWDGKYSLSFRYGDKREFKGIVKEVAGENILMLPPFKGTTDDFEIAMNNTVGKKLKFLIDFHFENLDERFKTATANSFLVEAKVKKVAFEGYQWHMEFEVEKGEYDWQVKKHIENRTVLRK